MFIPALEAEGAKEYHFEIGDPIRTVGLWKRYGDVDEAVPDEFTAEYPVFQNTRGQAVWNSEDVETRNTGVTEPTAAFWSALDQLTNSDPGDPIDVRLCEWYEREVIHSLVGMLESFDADELPEEIGELLAYARRQVERGDRDE